MIYTLTLNPALDYVMFLDKFTEGKTNRSTSEEILLGGKGINVSVVLNRLGKDTTTLGFLAGFSGVFLENQLKAEGFAADFIYLNEGYTRINVKLKGEFETEINAAGPEIKKSDFEALLKRIEKIKNGDTLVISGSIPKSLPSDTYEQILERINEKNINIAVDSTGDLLLKTLKFKPFIIKPNLDELSELIGYKADTDEKIISGALTLQKMGAQNVLVSKGKDGAVLLDMYGEIHKRSAHNIDAINTVGAGDSMLAGFLAGAEKGFDYALSLGTAAGGATAAAIGLAKREEIFKLL